MSVRAKSRALWGVALVVGALIAVIILPALWAKAPEPNGENWPHQLAGLELDHLVQGDEALQQISQLHGTTIGVEEGFIAMYGNNGEVTLWVSRSSNAEEAHHLFEAMDSKIQRGNQMFTGHQLVEIDNRQYHRVQGAGMDNYYYASGKAVYWVGLKSVDANNVLREIQRLFG